MVSESPCDSVGGVVAEIFRSLLRKPTRFSGGGVVAEIFRRGGPGLQKAGGTRNFALITHFYVFPKGGPGPPGPPLNRPLNIIINKTIIIKLHAAFIAHH